MNQKIIENFIELVKGITKKEDLIQEIVMFLKKETLADGIGLRIKEDYDYPYYTTFGFPEHFVKVENFLCRRDECGNVIRDTNGNAILECMCGDVITKNYDPSKSYFTSCGSFYLDKANAEIIEDIKANHCMIRGRCMQEGYKSVVLIPVPYEDTIIGLIQLNDKTQDKFKLETIKTVEEIAKIIGKALGGIIRLEEEKDLKRKTIQDNIKKISNDLEKLTTRLLNKYSK